MHELIEKWKLNKGLLSSKMNMPLGTFCNKLNPKHTAYFTDAETIQLKAVLMDLSGDIDALGGIDFNDALKVIVS